MQYSYADLETNARYTEICQVLELHMSYTSYPKVFEILSVQRNCAVHSFCTTVFPPSTETFLDFS